MSYYKKIKLKYLNYMLAKQRLIVHNMKTKGITDNNKLIIAECDMVITMARIDAIEGDLKKISTNGE